MGRLELQPFGDEHLERAGELLAARHRRHRADEPLLPARFEDPEAARGEVEALWRADETPGAVAVRDGAVVGYLVGMRKDDGVWGPNVWVESAGFGVEEAEDVRDLYAAAAEAWVRGGRVAHYAIVPTTDATLVEAWSRVGFGQQHAYGIRELPEVEWPDGAREARLDDVERLLALAPLLAEHQLLSPVFSRKPPDDDEQSLRTDIEEDISTPSTGCLVLEREGRIVGNFVIYPLEVSSMHTGLARPEGISFLGWAATLPERRGSGAGVALAQAGFAWARARGYGAMVTDWRVTNLLASRFWPRRGFRTTFLRLHRLLP